MSCRGSVRSRSGAQRCRRESPQHDFSDRELRPIAAGTAHGGKVKVTDRALGADMPSLTDRAALGERVRGMLLGLAVGDALGSPTEGMLRTEREATFGEIRDYLPNRYAGGRAVGLPSDDTQLSFWTVEHILREGQLRPQGLGELFASRRIFGLGGTVREFLTRQARGGTWTQWGVRSAGNGALMRIAPVLLLHLGQERGALRRDVADCAALTHRDPAAISSAVAWADILGELLREGEVPDPGWWAERYVAVARAEEGDVPRYLPRSPRIARRAWCLWGLVGEVVPEALRRGLSVREGGDWWYSGAYLLETVPSVLHILARHAGDPEEAIVRAVNDTKDNDTIASLVGSAVGAIHGASGLPGRWIRGLSARTREDDDGRVLELIDAALQRFLDEGNG